MNHKGDKLFRLFAWIAIIGAGLIMFTFAYWRYYPYKTIEFEQPFQVLNENKTVKRGEDMLYYVNWIKYTDMGATSVRDIVCENGNRLTLDSRDSNVPAGSGERVGVLPIPNDLRADGVCKYRSVLLYEPNHIRTITIRLESEPFLVTE